MSRFDDIIRQTVQESVKHKDTRVTFNQIDQRNRETKGKKRWLSKLNVGLGSLVAVLLVGLLSMSLIHPHLVNRSRQTSPHTKTSHTHVSQSGHTSSQAKASQTSVNQSGQTPSNGSMSQNLSTINKTTYPTLSKANSVFYNYHLPPFTSSKTIDLGSGIQAHYLYSSKYRIYNCFWTQRNWTVSFESYVNDQLGKQEAEKISNYLKTAKLPKAKKTGVISFIPNSPFDPQVSWQDGKTIYSLKRTDPTWLGLNNLSYSVFASPTSKTPTTLNPLFQTTLTLPNGFVLKPNQSINWKEMSLQLLISGLPSKEGSISQYAGVVGNHSQIISHEKIATSVGMADFVLNKRTPPAASKSTKATYEYWVIVYGSRYAYAIEAAFTGNKDQAKSEVMELVKKWKVPK